MTKKNYLTINHQPLVVRLGFTLIEMLVVISLIGILAALGLASFTSAQKQARDSVRRSDLKQYQTSLEVYGNLTNGLYPTSVSASASVTLCSYLNNKLEPDISCSEDPKYASDNTFIYRYISDGAGGGGASATKYILWSKLENKTSTYWLLCSNGKTGESATAPSSSACPI